MRFDRAFFARSPFTRTGALLGSPREQRKRRIDCRSHGPFTRAFRVAPLLGFSHRLGGREVRRPLCGLYDKLGGLFERAGIGLSLIHI